MPAVFKAPIRPDVVNFVHTNMRKNSRQPYAVSELAGECVFDLNLQVTGFYLKVSWLHAFTTSMYIVCNLCDCVYFRPPDQCRVLGNRKSCGPYPSCEGWWYTPLWPGCFWKCILLNQNFSFFFLIYLSIARRADTKDLQWWCNLRLTLWPVTVCLLSYAGTDGWRSLSLSRYLELEYCVTSVVVKTSLTWV